MVNRNRMFNDNRRNNNFNRSNSGEGMGNMGGMGGYGRQMSPWQGGVAPGGALQGNTMPTSTEATLALANNLISNLLQTRQSPSVSSLLDINVRRDYGGGNRMNNYGNGGFIERRNVGNISRMGARDMHHMGNLNRGNFVSNRGFDGGIRKPQRPNNQANKGNKQHANKQNSVKKEKPAADKLQSAESSADPPAASENATDEENVKKDGTVSTQFDEIPAELLECHICEKKMWDGRSFDNHINGRAHHIMMDKTRESYRMTANTIRQELRITEMRRDRKLHPTAKKILCAMCDLYVVMGGAHRRSLGHQKLKKYLHPTCNTCRKEMPTRIELDEHRLTVQHMKTVQEKLREMQGKPKQEVMTMSTLHDELALVRGFVDGNKKQPKGKTETEGQEEATDDKPTEGVAECGSVVVKMETDQENKETSPSEEPEYVILDYQEGDDMSEMTRKNLPRYDPQRPLGTSFVTEFSCKHCSLCKKLFDCDEAAKVHLKTYKHFNAFSKLIRSKGMFKTVQGKSDDELKRKHDNIAESEMVDENKRVKLENEDEAAGDENWETEENIEEAIDSAVADNTEIDESILDEPVVEEAPLSVPAPEIPPVIPSVNSPSIGRGRGRGARGKRGGIAPNKNKI